MPLGDVHVLFINPFIPQLGSLDDNFRSPLRAIEVAVMSMRRMRAGDHPRRNYHFSLDSLSLAHTRRIRDPAKDIHTASVTLHQYENNTYRLDGYLIDTKLASYERSIHVQQQVSCRIVSERWPSGNSIVHAD